MGVKLIEPLTGGIVEAHDEEAASRLEARGFKRAEPAPKKAPRKRAAKK